MNEPRYFRCAPLHSTLGVADCRRNRALPHRVRMQNSSTHAIYKVAPLPCRDCALARDLDAGRVRLYTAEEVALGAALGASVLEPSAHTYDALPLSER